MINRENNILVTVIGIRHGERVGVGDCSVRTFHPFPHVGGFVTGGIGVYRNVRCLGISTEKIGNDVVDRFRRDREIVNRRVLGFTTEAVHLHIELIHKCVGHAGEVSVVNSKRIGRIRCSRNKLSVASPLVSAADVVVLNLGC